ncbi:hypothetical protein Q7P37_008760 [Cladosporium fusiforme]
MFSRTAFSVASQTLRPRRNPLLSPRFAALQKSFLSTEVRSAIDKAVASAPVVLFMKGTPETPQCGFSRAAIQILGLQGVNPQKFTAFNVLEDEELRQGIKEYSDWQTIPQLYIGNEFVGGTDILMSMHQDGSLSKLLEEKDVLVSADEHAAFLDPGIILHTASLSAAPSESKTDDMNTTNKRAAATAAQHHAKKPKTTVSVAGLFAKKRPSQNEHEDPPDSTTRKQAGHGSREDVETARAKQHPAYIEVKEATKVYGACKANTIAAQLNAAEEELASRIDGIDINGKPLNLPGVPTQAELRALEDDEKLLRPLTEDIITIAVTKSDGTVAHKHIKLGDSMEKIRELFDETETRVNELIEEVTEVDEEIQTTLRDFNKSTQAVGDVLRRKIAKLEADVEAYYEQTVEEISNARKEDKKLNMEANGKVQAFMASLF